MNPLFRLSDGTDVYKGDILWHPDLNRVGWCCVAEFEPQGDSVVVRSPSGAVPTVLISELKKSPPRNPAFSKGLVFECPDCGYNVMYEELVMYFVKQNLAKGG